jgi:hypothetical protein
LIGSAARAVFAMKASAKISAAVITANLGADFIVGSSF